MNYKLDTDKQVFFYEQEFYVFSNFSSFELKWKKIVFKTSEHAYHWEKFDEDYIKEAIKNASSAHDAFKYAQIYSKCKKENWDAIKVDVMYNIIKEKTTQHPYVKKKLLETGNRKIIEDSWRDDFWGWGPNKDGKNMLGLLWMKLRYEVMHETQIQKEMKFISVGSTID